MSLIAHKEARFLFPLAILATAFPVLGFSPRLPRWRGRFARIWHWREILGGESRHRAFRCWRWSISRSIPLACGRTCRWRNYLYRHGPGTVYSFARALPVLSDVPARRDSQSESCRTPAQLNALLDKGPVFLMSETPVAAGAAARMRAPPCSIPNFRWRALAMARPARIISAAIPLLRRATFLKLLPLYWYTLYRVERSATIRS